MKPNLNRNISRAEQPYSETRSAYGGWMVRFHRNGKVHQSFFGDSKHGGKRKALGAARQKRDEIEAQLGPIQPDYVALATRPTARNTSKTVGVRWHHKVIRRGELEYNYTFAIASWTKDPVSGARATRNFIVGKYSRREAWDLALKARAKGLREYKRAVKALSSQPN